MNEWKEYRLSDIAEVLNRMRIPLNSRERANRQGKYPYYGASGVFDYIDDYIFDGQHVLIAEDGENLRSRQTPIAFLVDGKFWVNNHAHILKGIDELINEFIVFYFQCLNINPFITGAAQPKLNLENLLSIPILMPEREERISITKLLNSLDRKIENLRRQNETLEEIAQTLFKHWFVDFEFPNADGQPYKSSGGEMVPSELGDIPAGWHVEPLDQVADFLNGLALQKYPPIDNQESLPVIKIREMKSGVTASTDRASLDIPIQYIIDNGDVLFSWSGSLEIVVWCFGKGALNQHLFKVSSKKYPKWFYYLWTLEHLTHFRAIAKSKATTMGHIQRKHLSEALCLVPSEGQLSIMNAAIQPIFQKNISNSLQIQTLTQTRDTLLPKLISGQLRINE